MEKLYHGSDNMFKKFSLKHLGKNGKAQGFGVYLASKEESAKMYGDIIYEVDVKLDKELSLNKITLKKMILTKILKELHKSNDILNDFNDVDYYGSNFVLNETINNLIDYNDNDVDIINELYNLSNDVIYVLEKLGYTHCIASEQLRTKDNVYIVFNVDNISIKNIKEIDIYER